MDANALLAIYTKVQQIYNTGDSKFLSFPLDFQYVFSPESLSLLFEEDAADAVSSLNQRADFSRAMNRPVKSLFPSTDTGDLLWDVYHEILTTAEIADSRLSPAEEKSFQEAEDYLFVKDENGLTVPSEKYKLYSEFRDRDFAFEEEMSNIKVSESLSEESRKNELAKLKKAKVENEQLWSAGGLRKEVEKHLAFREKVLASSPHIAWARMKDKCNADLSVQTDLMGGSFASTFLFPSNILDQPWCTINVGKDEVSALLEQASPDIRKRLTSDYTDPIESFSFEYRSVGIQRPWMDADLFKSRSWRFPDSTGQMISYGTDALAGRFPAYISALLLLRNFKITYSSGVTSSSFVSLSSNQTGSSGAVAILAYICKKIPLCPNPDESVAWPSVHKTASLQLQQKTGGKIDAYWSGEKADSGMFPVGDKFVFKARPDEKYILTQWKVNGVFINNVDYTYECVLPAEGLTVVPCWELGDSPDTIRVRIDKDKLISIDKGPNNLDMNRYSDLYRIKVIGAEAFKNYSNLCSLTLGNFVEIIGENAFFDCQKLERISIPASTQTIHKDAFARDNYQSEPIINVDPLNETYTTLQGILIEKSKTSSVQTLTCRCGAKYFFMDKAPTICPACGCPMDSSLKTEEIIRLPDVKAPFKITQQEAEELVHKFYAKKGFAAKDFKASIAESALQLRPVYAPYWEWNVQANGTYTIKVLKPEKNQQANASVESQVEIHTQNVSIPETKVSVPASRVVKGDAIDTNSTYTDAFSFANAPEGIAFELYSKNYSESRLDERAQVERKLQELAKKPYQASLLKSCENSITNFISETNRLLLNPIWVGSFDFKEKTYPFYIDGYSGKVTSKKAFPKNWGKIAKLAGGILAAIAAIILLIILLKPKSTSTTGQNTSTGNGTTTTATTSNTSTTSNSNTNTTTPSNTSTASSQVIFSHPAVINCDGVYMSNTRLHENLGSQLDRDCFEISFDFNSTPGKSDNDNIIVLDTRYRSLALVLKDNNTICVRTNNGSNSFDTPVTYKNGEWQHIDLLYNDGEVTINGNRINTGKLNGPGDNILSSNNFSNGHSFKGNIKNLVVKNVTKTAGQVTRPSSSNQVTRPSSSNQVTRPSTTSTDGTSSSRARRGGVRRR